MELESQGPIESAPVESAASEQTPAAAPAAPVAAAPEGAGEKIKEVATGLDKLNLKIAAKKAADPAKTVSEPLSPAKAPGEPLAPSAYTPDIKFKAAGVEKEIPELFRGVIKDKKTEDEVKELLTRAYGQEETKSKNEQLTQSLQQIAPRLQNFESGLKDLRQTFQRGDIEGWLRKLEVPEEVIYKWVLDKANYSKLPPEQQAMVDQRRNAERQAWQAQDNVGRSSSRELELETQMKALQLDSSLGKPDVKAMQDAFDARVGKPGAFRNAIASHGEAVWLRSNGQQNLTPDQAIQDFVRCYGDPSKFAVAPAAVTPAPANTTPATEKVKVIPRVDGSSVSPLKSKIRSIDDIKKRSKEMAAQQRA